MILTLHKTDILSLKSGVTRRCAPLTDDGRVSEKVSVTNR